MKRYRLSLLLIAVVTLLGLGYWLVPVALRAIPSRYLAAYAPEFVQSIAAGDHAELLPTAAAPGSSAALLSVLALPTAPSPTATATPLPQPALTATVAATAPPGPTALPSATPTPALALPPTTARLEGVRHEFQTWNNCGPATLAMALSYFGLSLTQVQTAPVLKPNPEDRNVTPEELAAFVNNETDQRALFRANGSLYQLRQFLAHGMPVIIEVGIDPPGDFAWMEWYGHYLLAVAYDDQAASIWTYDSWFGTSDVPGANANSDGRAIPYDELTRYWEQFNHNYVVLYTPEQAPLVAQIVGAQMDDAVMWQENLDRMQTALAADQENPYSWFNLGTALSALGNHERAAAAFDQARALGLPWRMLWYQFGPYEAYYETGRYEEVIVLADATMQNRPYFEEAFYYKGLAQIALGNVADGRRNLTRAAEFNPNFLPAAEALQNLDITSS